MTTNDSWGALEHRARMDDIAAVKRREITLDVAHQRAEDRRRKVGLLAGEAAALVSAHVRDLRYASMREATK